MTGRLTRPAPTAVLFDFFGTLVEVDRDAPSMAEMLSNIGYDCPSELEVVWNSLGFDGLVAPRAAGGAYHRWRRQNLVQLVRMARVPNHLQSEVVELLLNNDRAWT
jgi:FMN phosphatase YigB (HAD superfamily)